MTTQDYNKCVDEQSDGVYRFILKNMRDSETAKDVVQDAFTKMWEKRKTVDGKKAKSYVFTAAYHTMIDYIRKDRKSSVDENFLERSLVNDNLYSDINEVLQDALQKLPEIQKSVILLRDYEGYSYKEIGEIVNLSESQVKVYIYRARVALKKYIGCLDMVI